MAQNLFDAEHFKDERKAYRFVEQLRWPDGPVCVHCGATKVYRLKVKNSRRQILKCGACRKQFTATVGTIFEDSHIPLTKWLMAIQLLGSSKKGISSHQLHRMLGITYKSAWFMAHRIRHAVTDQAAPPKLSGTVEADETYVGGYRPGPRGRGADNKTPVFALVQRGGSVRSLVMSHVTAKNLRAAVRTNVERSAQIMTDAFRGYRGLKGEFAGHESVNHAAGEYARGSVHTNTVEGYFSLLKRGIIGTYHHVGAQHLHRYLAEFDFRYNTRTVDDLTRALVAVKGTEGKRLQYQ